MFELLMGKKKVFSHIGPFALFSSTTNQLTDFTNKVFFESGGVTASTRLNVNLIGRGAVGNRVVGVFAGGIALSNVVTRFHYADDAVSSGANLSQPRYGLCGIGNETLGFFVAGQAGGLVTRVDKHDYSLNTTVYATEIGTARHSASGGGNGALGIITGGHTSSGATNSCEKYTYATNARVNSSGLSRVSKNASASSTPTKLYIFAGVGLSEIHLKSTLEYNISSGASSPGGDLSQNVVTHASAGNSEFAVIAGGNTNSEATKESSKYTYAQSTSVPHTQLTHPKNNLSATSSDPGGF